MELRLYWGILRRYWLIVVGLTALTLALSVFSLAALPQPNPTYQATTRVALRPQSTPVADIERRMGEYYEYIASEFLNDDLIEVLQGPSFLETIRARVGPRPEGPPAGTIRAKKAHRVLAITVDSSRGEDALLIAREAARLLADPALTGPFTAQNQLVTVVDPPVLTVQHGGARSLLDVALRTLLGLFAGAALAFLLNYLDDSVRDGADASRATGLPVLAEIPPERRR